MKTRLEPSRYLAFFKEHRERIRGLAHVVGDVILVERVKLPEAKTASGIILTESRNQLGTIAADKPVFCRVLLPGEGFYDEATGESKALDVEPGDIVLVSGVGVKYFSSFPLMENYESDSLAITTESNIQMRFKGEEAFHTLLGEINQAAKGKVEA